MTTNEILALGDRPNEDKKPVYLNQVQQPVMFEYCHYETKRNDIFAEGNNRIKSLLSSLVPTTIVYSNL